MEPVTPIARLDFKDGRWIRIHLASVNQQIAIMDLPTAEGTEAQTERIRFWREELENATVETSWGGAASDGFALSELYPLINLWLVATEEHAVPPASESSSDTPPGEPLSEAPTASRRRSGSRRSSKS